MPCRSRSCFASTRPRSGANSSGNFPDALAVARRHLRRRPRPDRLGRLSDVPRHRRRRHYFARNGRCWSCSSPISPGSPCPSPPRIVGFLHLLVGRPRPAALPDKLTTRTAVIMPIYNEAPSRVFGAIAGDPRGCRGDRPRRAPSTGSCCPTLDRSRRLDRRGAGADRPAPRRLGPQARVYYRHRAKNTARKAGNVGDFVSRWGGFLRPYGGARRRQPDDRPRHRLARRRPWRPIPTPASSRPCR